MEISKKIFYTLCALSLAGSVFAADDDSQIYSVVAPMHQATKAATSKTTTSPPKESTPAPTPQTTTTQAATTQTATPASATNSSTDSDQTDNMQQCRNMLSEVQYTPAANTIQTIEISMGNGRPLGTIDSYTWRNQNVSYTVEIQNGKIVSHSATFGGRPAPPDKAVPRAKNAQNLAEMIQILGSGYRHTQEIAYLWPCTKTQSLIVLFSKDGIAQSGEIAKTPQIKTNN